MENQEIQNPEEQVSNDRMYRLRKGDCLTSSDLFEQERRLSKGGCCFVIRGENNVLEYVQIFKPNQK